MQLAYRKTSGSATTWPEPLEGIYQSQSRGRRLPGAQRRDITVPARLLIAAVVALGRQRPHGMITWLAGAWRTSRQTIYAIGERIEQQLEEAEQEAGEAAAAVLSRDELAGATLTLLIAGTMTVRRVRWCLARLLGREPSVGWVSDLVAEAGSRAEKALRRADWSGTPMMIAARDELYDGDFAYLLMVDPVSLAIIHGEVVDKVDSDTWSLALADGVQRTSFRVEGLVEDAATHFPPSVDGALMLVDGFGRPPVQKDNWHLLREAGTVRREIEADAWRALERAEAKATQPVESSMLHIFEWDWEEAHEQAGGLLDQESDLRAALSLLPAALEPIDARTNNLLDRDTAKWYLDAIADALDGVGLSKATKLAATIRRQSHDLLTHHDWLARDVPDWRSRALKHFGDPEVAALFERAVLRACRLERAVTNGRHEQRLPARSARMALEALCQGDEHAPALADALVRILDRSVRVSSAVECLNGILRQFLAQRRHFHDRRRAQHWLDLLVLWHNMRPFERGKRKGKSPFELAGVTITAPDGQAANDWLHALGYAPAA